jgi:Ca2+-binding RTX toxin-like protein
VDAVGADDTNDSDADASGITGVYDLTAGEYDDTADAGVVLNPPPVLPPGRHDDLIEGGDGNDVIYGGFGNDEIQGEGGKDHITGGVDDGKVLWSGNKLAVAIGDNLYGNNGTDTYHYAKGDGVDMIWDFRPGEDVIDVQGFDPSQVKVTYVEGVTNWIGTGAHKKLTLTFRARAASVVV